MDYLNKDRAAIEEMLQQAPPHVEYEEAKLAYHNAKRNISQALADLWNLPPPPEKKKPTGVNAEKWAEVRTICDEFDAAAVEAIKASWAPQSIHTDTPIMNTCEDKE
jgi:hypothetical protein